VEGFESRELTVDDGVTLRTYVRPAPSEGAPTLVLCNGLGGNIITWRHQVARLGQRYRIVTWDYRGLYGSALPPGRRQVALDVPRHARDAIAVADAHGVESAVFVGWSMGVQLNFELFRLIPERMAGLIQIAGSYGRSLTTTRFGKPGERLIMPAMAVFRQVVERGSGLVDRVLDSGVLIEAARRLGLVAPSIDVALTHELVRAYVKLDFEVYNKILATLGDHDARDVLPGLDRPVLIIAGDKDPMTPSWLSERMKAELPRAELVIVKGGSHYVPVEFPERVNAALSSWLERHGL